MDKSPPPPAWHEWLAQHAGRFLLYARQQTRCEADAEDVLQEALVECWKRGRYGESAPAAALVFATIRRRAIDLARGNDRRALRETAHVQISPPWFSHSVDEDEKELELAVKNLPPIYREVITLKVWGELTFQEIGSTVGISLNTAASRYRYGLDLLRDAMKGVPR